uniref:Uncharacterized protein n=1 Tax=Tetradesmus obliquus TaxID=3088 RepID=A0A383VSM6_TETOB
MQLSALDGKWLKRGDMFSQGLNPSFSTQPAAQDAAMLQLLCSVACKLLRFICSDQCLDQGTADSRERTGGTLHGSSSSSSTAGSSSVSSASAGPRRLQQA